MSVADGLSGARLGRAGVSRALATSSNKGLGKTLVTFGLSRLYRGSIAATNDQGRPCVLGTGGLTRAVDTRNEPAMRLYSASASPASRRLPFVRAARRRVRVIAFHAVFFELALTSPQSCPHQVPARSRKRGKKNFPSGKWLKLPDLRDFMPW